MKQLDSPVFTDVEMSQNNVFYGCESFTGPIVTAAGPQRTTCVWCRARVDGRDLRDQPVS